VFPRQPADVIFKLSLFLQQWRPLLRHKDYEWVDMLTEASKNLHRVHSFKNQTGSVVRPEKT
jgi:hypothetical protein